MPFPSRKMKLKHHTGTQESPVRLELSHWFSVQGFKLPVCPPGFFLSLSCDLFVCPLLQSSCPMAAFPCSDDVRYGRIKFISLCSWCKKRGRTGNSPQMCWILDTSFPPGCPPRPAEGTAAGVGLPAGAGAWAGAASAGQAFLLGIQVHSGAGVRLQPSQRKVAKGRIRKTSYFILIQRGKDKWEGKSFQE